MFNVFNEFGNFIGWLIIFTYAGTILNYILKIINKIWGKKITSGKNSKKIMAILMKLFVRNHKYWGLGSTIFLILHFLIQFSTFGINLTGAIAAGLLLFQIFLGVYASLAHKSRKGAWFILHRTIALLIMIGIAFHLILPFALNKPSVSITDSNTTSASSENTKVFTLEVLSQYNGKDGQPAYVAYKGIVYDVTNLPQWENGTHNGQEAGTDLTNDISRSPHGDSVFANLSIVGTLE